MLQSFFFFFFASNDKVTNGHSLSDSLLCCLLIFPFLSASTSTCQGSLPSQVKDLSLVVLTYQDLYFILPLVTGHNSTRTTFMDATSIYLNHIMTILFKLIMQPSRLLCPWDSPGKNTVVGCQSLLQRIFTILELNLGLLHCRYILHCLSYKEVLLDSLYQYFIRWNTIHTFSHWFPDCANEYQRCCTIH